jgi:hypothetical protein
VVIEVLELVLVFAFVSVEGVVVEVVVDVDEPVLIISTFVVESPT